MKDLQHSFHNSDEYYHDPEKCEHAGPKVKGGFSLRDWHRHGYAVSSLMDMTYWSSELHPAVTRTSWTDVNPCRRSGSSLVGNFIKQLECILRDQKLVLVLDRWIGSSKEYAGWLMVMLSSSS
ncbi:hypothetical protein Tco_0011347 [Tanacetum coccineum]